MEISLIILNSVVTADPRYLCGSWASCFIACRPQQGTPNYWLWNGPHSYRTTSAFIVTTIVVFRHRLSRTGHAHATVERVTAFGFSVQLSLTTQQHRHRSSVVTDLKIL